MTSTGVSSLLYRVDDSSIEKSGICLYVKQLSLPGYEMFGNKPFKLKYNLSEAKKRGNSTLLTYGGPYSNHILAVAILGNKNGFKTIGIIRGEEHLPLNPMLQKAVLNGMHLHHIDRESYRLKHTAAEINKLKKIFEDFYHIPEGGSNALAVKGCAEIPVAIPVKHDVICCPVGTGGTLAGLTAGAKSNITVIGFSSLKTPNDYPESEVKRLLSAYNELPEIKSIRSQLPFKIEKQYHFGGFAKKTLELTDFMEKFTAKTSIPLDFVYTGKMMFGIYDMISKGKFKKGQTIVAVHTGDQLIK